ncbi:hypothetical protein BH09MYX1_BH09MYX1_66820 [soil metagenome]
MGALSVSGVVGLVGVVALSAIVAAPRTARADEKSACIDAAESSQKMRKAGQLTEARIELLKCTRDACPKVVRDDCTSWIAEVDKETPSIIVRAKSPKDEDLDGAVWIDGRMLKGTLDGTPLPLDPGPHTVKVAPSDGSYAEGETKVIVAVGEKNRIVALALHGVGTTTIPIGADEVKRPGKSTRWIGWTLGGVGLASLATFAILEVLAQSDYSEMKDSACGKATTCGSDVLDPIRSKFVAGGILLGIGGALVVTSVIWIIADRPAPTTALRFGVSPTAGGAGLSLSGSF